MKKVQVSDNDHTKLKVLAAQNKCSIPSIINELLKEHTKDTNNDGFK